MKHYDNHQIEQALYQEGYKFIAGCDEVGRGPLIGPVVAGAVIMPEGLLIEGVTDSKKVSAKNREILAKEIKEKALAYAVYFIDNETIDEINILEASRLAMQKAIGMLEVKPDIILADEPTGQLDSKTKKEIAELFKAISAEGRTILVVTHDDGLAKTADRIIRISDGKIVSADEMI